MVENMQQVSLPLEEVSDSYSFQAEQKEEALLDPKVFSSLLISCKMQGEENSHHKDPHARLLELMHSSPVRSILQASQMLSKEEGISAQDALQQIILSFKEIDQLWNQVLLNEGLARLSSQYH